MPWVKPNGHWEWSSDEAGYSFNAEALHRPKSETGDRWGPWIYNSNFQTLTYRKEHSDYEVRLDEITTAEKAIDWLAQLQEKGWMSSEELGDFVNALADLVGLRPLAHPRG